MDGWIVDKKLAKRDEERCYYCLWISKIKIDQGEGRHQKSTHSHVQPAPQPSPGSGEGRGLRGQISMTPPISVSQPALGGETETDALTLLGWHVRSVLRNRSVLHGWSVLFPRHPRHRRRCFIISSFYFPPVHFFIYVSHCINTDAVTNLSRIENGHIRKHKSTTRHRAAVAVGECRPAIATRHHQVHLHHLAFHHPTTASTSAVPPSSGLTTFHHGVRTPAASCHCVCESWLSNRCLEPLVHKNTDLQLSSTMQTLALMQHLYSPNTMALICRVVSHIRTSLS